MSIQLRWFQDGAAKALFEAVKKNEKNSNHPVAALPTGSGKSYTICEFIDLWLSYKPTSNILVLSHVAEILEQNHASLESWFEVEVGLYSAGLDSKTHEKITVAGIQSVHRKIKEFSKYDIIIIDEAHRVPIKENTMYRKFLDKVDANYVGLTATPFRLGHGYIYKGEDALFNNLCYDATSMETYNRIVEEGYLSEMFTKNTALKLDAQKEKVKTTAGDYNDKSLSQAFDREHITKSAVKEAVEIFKLAKRKLMLVFAIDIEHAENIARMFRECDLRVVCIHSQMDGNRKKEIKYIKGMVYDVVVNVDVLTTGFDAPRIDHIVDLKPTKSPVQHIQKLGRGARIHPEKDYCLISDFAGNVATLGPINNVQIIEKKKKGEGGGEPIQKICNECGCYNFPSVKHCVNCGEEFLFIEKIKTNAYEGQIVQENSKQWLKVSGIQYSIINSPGKPSCMRVTYNCGLSSFSERIYYDGKGFMRQVARNWVRYRLGIKNPNDMPKNLNDLFPMRFDFKIPTQIKIDNTGKYTQVVEYRFF